MVASESTPPAGEPGKGGTVVAIGGDPAILAPAAARLGVTPQQLADAFKAAGEQLMPAQAVPCGAGSADAIVVLQGNDDALFAAVAQQLGRGISAAQVREAMQLVQPPASPPAPAPDGEKAQFDQYLQALAAALHVSVDQLQAAMQQASDCGSPATRPATPAAGLAICFSIAGTPLPPPLAP
jgi:hypothetical protein